MTSAALPEPEAPSGSGTTHTQDYQRPNLGKIWAAMAAAALPEPETPSGSGVVLLFMQAALWPNSGLAFEFKKNFF